MSRSESVKKWRENTKSRAVEAMGGKCVCCDYDICNDALEFHHLIPDEKEFGIGNALMHPRSWVSIVDELRKCVLVCNRCHKEIHKGIRKLPEKFARFNEEFLDYKIPLETEPCPICGEQKPLYLITCSRKCAGKKNSKIDWNSFDLLENLKTKTVYQVAEELKISDMAVRKRLKKISIIQKVIQ